MAIIPIYREGVGRLWQVVLVWLGYISINAYHEAMGFPPALFPPESALLPIMGFLHGIPAIVIVSVMPLIGLFGWKAGKNIWFRNVIVKKVKEGIAIQLSSFILVFIAFIVAWLMNVHPLVASSLYAILVFSASAWLANTQPIKVGILCGLLLAFLIYSLSIFVMRNTRDIAMSFGRQEVKAILVQNEPRFSTVIPIEGVPYTPGEFASNGFAGFIMG